MKILNLFKARSITGQIISVTMTLLLAMTFAIVIPFGVVTFKAEQKKLQELKELLYSNFDLTIRQEVETARSLVENVYKQHTDGLMEKDVAKKLAADLVRDLRYGAEGYFWIDTKDGTNVVLLGKDAEGKNRIDLQDKKGNLFIQDIINAALNGGGYTDYWFPKKGSDKPLPKRGYSLYFEPFNWVIGTGNYIDDIDAAVEAEHQKELARFRSNVIMLVITSIVALVICVLVSIVFGRSFSRPIILLSKKTEELATGDLNIVFDNNRKDEIGILQKSLNATVEKLRNVIREVIDGSANVSAASGQMSKTAEYIAQGANTQSASTEEISSSVEEMAANIQSNTENASVTEDISVNTEANMNELQNTLKLNLDSMKEIKSKTNIINEIATQTNLLALNAAVEAARAGEYGRGFAVVAAEVRKLSDYTQRAAADIDNLTATSLGSAEESWENLEKLLPEIQATVERVREISSSSREQDIGAGQINNAVQELVNVTSQNAASSEQLASSSEELSRQSEQLHDVISFFKVDK